MNGTVVTAMIATIHASTRFQVERPSWSRATSSAPTAIGHAVSFMAAASPRLIPARLRLSTLQRHDPEQHEREDRHVVAAG